MKTLSNSSSPRIFIETSRLILRDWTEEDITPLYLLNSSEQVMKFFMKTSTKEESLEFYRKIREEIERYGYGIFAMQRKDSGAFIGLLGLHHISFESNFSPGVEIGWRLIPEAWGQGLATEGAKACLLYARDVLKLPKVYALTSLPNKPSEKVMQRIGMQRMEEFDHPQVSEGHPLRRHILYVADLSHYK